MKSKLKQIEVWQNLFKWDTSGKSQKLFINEILTLQMLEEAKKLKKVDHCPYFAEYMGFVVNSDKYEYFGTILIKWYPLWRLSNYLREMDASNTPIKRSELVDLASQIARGKISANNLEFILRFCF